MKWKDNLAMKALAFMMAATAFAVSAIMGWYQIVHYEVLWRNVDFSQAYSVYALEQMDSSSVRSLIWQYREVELSQTDQASSELETRLSAEHTNLRWQARRADGSLVYGNTQESAPSSGLYRTEMDLYVSDSDTERLEVILWVDGALQADDDYQRAIVSLTNWREHRVAAIVGTLACVALGAALSVMLCAGCCHKEGYEGPWLNWFHRIPGDLLAAALIIAGGFTIALMLWGGDTSYCPMALRLTAIGLGGAGTAALAMALLITFAARCKTHTLLRNTLVYRFCAWCFRTIWAILMAIPVVWRTAVLGLAYLLFSLLTFDSAAWLLWLMVTLLLILYLCLWSYQWRKIRRGAREIIGGCTDYQIDTARMLPDLRAHADELNNLGQSIAQAVDERMRSEHFKAELITNVSHDLKTPLTSIINYVDLLKKEDVDNPRVAEYIEVLDRKSQRLKKLTEDLVEASKASTGVLTVNLERLDLVQLADQALAEYEDRLAQQGLTVVRTLPEGPVWISGDGRHLWRVIDNLLSNCAKYALEGTRVYVEIQTYSDCAKLSVKNISREALNIPPERLVERFVRGDESRTAEGSGLGLSIAQSLTELQKGAFQVSIDGDLFKATVTLPLAGPTEFL